MARNHLLDHGRDVLAGIERACECECLASLCDSINDAWLDQMEVQTAERVRDYTRALEAAALAEAEEMSAAAHVAGTPVATVVPRPRQRGPA